MEYHDLELTTTYSESKDQDLCLLLIGRIGCGKSASGNSILESHDFKSANSTEPVTTHANMSSKNVNGRKIKVVDTPGLGDTRIDTVESVEAAIKGLKTGMGFSDGFDALVLVFQFGKRLTDEDRQATSRLIYMFGEDIIRDFTVVLFTHGDTFDHEETKMTFIEWVMTQKGFMGDLLQECGNKCVLFNNKTKDKAELSRQRQELLDCVDGLQSKGKRYTTWRFDQAKEMWMSVIRQRKNVKVLNETKDKNELNRHAQTQESNEMRQAELDQLRIENGVLRQQNKEQIKQFQDGIIKAQERMCDLVAKTMQESRRREDHVRVEIQREANEKERQIREEMRENEKRVRREIRERERQISKLERERRLAKDKCVIL